MGTVKFSGFPRIKFTPVPDVLFDELLSELTGAEIKALLYIVRRTYGFGKVYAPIGFEQMLSGLVSADGRVLDHGTGLSKTTLRSSLAKLRTLGVLEVDRRYDKTGQPIPSIYRLKFEGVSEHSDSGSTKNKEYPPTKNKEGGGTKNRTPQETVREKQVEIQEEKDFSLTPDEISDTPKNGWKRKMFDEDFWPVVWRKDRKDQAFNWWNKNIDTRSTGMYAIEMAKRQGPLLVRIAELRGHEILMVRSWLREKEWETPIADVQRTLSMAERHHNERHGGSGKDWFEGQYNEDNE